MATFLLTGKALKTLKKTVSAAPEIIPSFDGWYVDIFTVQRRKAVLITHEGTFLSFVCYLTDVGDSKKLFGWFLGGIESFLIQNCPNNHDRVMNLLLNKDLQGKTKKQMNNHRRYSLAWSAWVIARMGGWKGYACERPPGPITMHRGWKQYQAQKRGWAIALTGCVHTIDFFAPSSASTLQEKMILTSYLF